MLQNYGGDIPNVTKYGLFYCPKHVRKNVSPEIVFRNNNVFFFKSPNATQFI